MMTWAANQYGGVRTIGLCHGVQAGHRQIAEVLGLKQAEVDIVCANKRSAVSDQQSAGNADPSSDR